MPVVVVPGTPHAAEVLKWEYDTFQIGEDRGQRGPRLHVEFPKMLYRADRDVRNKIAIVEQIVVGDEDEQNRLQSRGFRVDANQAIDAAEAAERAVATLAANRAFTDRKMSPEAQAEAREYEASVPEHVAEVPAKKPGRPRTKVE